MALTDEQMQDLQEIVKDEVAKGHLTLSGKPRKIVVKDQFYQIAHNLNDVTQAIAVSPLDEAGNPNYQSTAIVITYLKESAAVYT
ncbi:hypothetical protein [Streptococcus dentiloxodontae]